MTEPSLYEQVLAQIEQGATPPATKPPRSSASVVLWRRRDDELEVFWVKRAEQMPFMGGFHAFPGGGLSRQDREVQVEGRPVGVDGAPERAALPVAVTDGIEDLGPILTPGLVACALRELHEETGLEVAAGKLVYAGRWLTPPLGPIRFDNRFFLLEWPEIEGRQPAAASSEAEYGEWIRPVRALERWRSGDVMTAPPILHILEVLDAEGPQRGLGRLREPLEANLGPHRRIEFRPGVLLFPLKTPTLPPATYTNSYVLGTERVVLVDPGSPFDTEIDRLQQAVAQLAAKAGRKVEAIWLTHHHPDHIGGVESLRRTLEVPVLAHASTAERLQSNGISIDDELVDGQRVVLEGDPPFPVRVFHTPGHARGHLCFLDETHGSLLTGDLVAGFGTIVVDPPEGNMEDYLTSLRRMRNLGPRALFPAHGPATKNAVAKLDEYLQHRLRREDRILQTWRAGRRVPREIFAEVYDDVPPIAQPLAERQIQAHLERLRATGKIGE